MARQTIGWKVSSNDSEDEIEKITQVEKSLSESESKRPTNGVAHKIEATSGVGATASLPVTKQPTSSGSVVHNIDEENGSVTGMANQKGSTKNGGHVNLDMSSVGLEANGDAGQEGQSQRQQPCQRSWRETIETGIRMCTQCFECLTRAIQCIDQVMGLFQ